ncbi:hypothetical protein CCZ01_05485 [Helicobacter monodelphidis]|uniref:DUF5644 domain-containing protein n=1 Tax=Helicobacter sp. 15-1451 TaxID=2004995 RepID=UPI000DCC3A20|nr:DUF5644 domain-containing protein [Helicobacter sp. 15-1451]RAX57594.1 hypothetical protein CCZ01_05485 [Helicobacter sp. 15-1451]
MKVKLDLTLQRFNIKLHYLAYECCHTTIVQETMLLSDLYKQLDSELDDFGYDKKSVCVIINGILVYEDVEIGVLCERFGYQWRVESFAPKATQHDLIVNREFLKTGLKQVEKICTLTQEEYDMYDSLMPFFSLTPISKSLEDYLGEGFFIFIANLAKNHPKKAHKLYELIDSPTNGVMNAMLLKGRIFPEKKEFDFTLLALQKSLLQGYPLNNSFWIDYAKNIATEVQ